MRILICGVGAIGSNLASLLVPDLKGEHEITILDMDKIEERNVQAGTQFYYPDQIGLSKVSALQYNLYKMFNREIKTVDKEIFSEHDARVTFEPEELIKDEKYGNQIATAIPYDLIIDCFDNYDSRLSVQLATSYMGLPCLHVGFSDQFTFAIEWDENYKVPSDITSGMDICTMEGASSFVKLVASIASLVVQEFIRKGERLEYIGNRLTIRNVA